MSTQLLLALLLTQMTPRPPIPPGAKVLTTKPQKSKRPQCLHKGNPSQVLKLARYEARITMKRESYNLTRTATFFYNTAWKRECDHFLKVGFPLTPSVGRGKTERVLLSFPPRKGSEKKLHLFTLERWKAGSSLPVNGFLGAAIQIPPMAGNPTDMSFTVTLEQRDIPLPQPVSWHLKRLPKRDITLTFSDFEIVDNKRDGKKPPEEPPSHTLLITIAVMALLSGGVLFAVYRRGKRGKSRGNGQKERTP